MHDAQTQYFAFPPHIDPRSRSRLHLDTGSVFVRQTRSPQRTTGSRRGDAAFASGNHHHRSARPHRSLSRRRGAPAGERRDPEAPVHRRRRDRKSTRLNSSHDQISYAVFCLKKKKKKNKRLFSNKKKKK